MVTWDSLNMVRNRFLSSSSGALSISSGVKRVLSCGGGGGVRFDCDIGGEGLRSLSILLLFLLFCCTSSSRRTVVVRPNTPRKSNFWAEKKKSNVHLCLPPSGRVSRIVLVFYLCGVIQFERGLLCYSPEMSSHLLLITFII